MTTNIESRVLAVLSAIEVSADAARRIQSWGNDAVTVVCEAALGAYPSMRTKIRSNAAAVIGVMDHPQAIETLPLLIGDSNPAVAIRAIRAAARRKHKPVVERLGQSLDDDQSDLIVVAEAARALIAIDSSESRALLDAFEAASPRANRHRGSTLVEGVLRERRKR